MAHPIKVHADKVVTTQVVIELPDSAEDMASMMKYAGMHMKMVYGTNFFVNTDRMLMTLLCTERQAKNVTSITSLRMNEASVTKYTPVK